MRKNKNFQKLMIYAIAAFMVLSAMSIVANAAFIEIGTGTSNSWYPTYGYWDYSYCGTIYLASEIGAAIDINKISYNIADYSGYSNTDYLIYDQEIYMTHTTLSTFPSSSPLDPTTMTQVYDGDVHFVGTGWFDISLDTSFSYNGVDNLIIYWENHDGDYQTGDPDFYYTYNSYGRTVYDYGDNSWPTTPSRTGSCPNVRLHFPTDHDVAVTDIVTPGTVEGYGSIPVHVEVKNNGLNGETFPVNVKINSPPVTLLQEDFESLYSVRPNPPAGWLMKDNNLDGMWYSTYTLNMWGSYYSSSYAHSGTMSMRCEDGSYGGGSADDWLFTPGVALTAGQNYNLDFWYATSSSSTSYKNRMSVYIGTVQHDSAMTTLLWQRIDFAQYYYNNYGFASVPINVPTTQTYYIAWHVFSQDYDADIFVDDVHLYLPGSTIYDQTVIMSNLGVGATSQANLPDWVVASPGVYEVIADAQLGTDEYLPDNILTQYTTVGLFDGQLDSIDIPQALMGPSPFNPEATVSNQGALNINSMPVHATVLDPSGGTGTVFEESFEGAPSLSVYEGEVTVEIDRDNVVDKFGEFERIKGGIMWPEDEPALGDPDQWTILNPDNNGAMWHLTDYRSSPTSPTHSMYHGDENTKLYLPNSMDILISPKIHIGNAGGSFSFDIYNDVEGAYYDNVFFGVSPDGMNWGWWFGGAWWMTWYNSGAVPIFSGDVDANGDGYVAFLFQSDSTVQFEGAYIDNVQVQGSPYLYDETVYVSLAPTATATVVFPEFEGIPGYNDYTISICCEEPKDSVPGNDCVSLMFNNNAPVWNLRTGFGFATIQGAIDDPGTIDGDTIMVNDGSFYEDIFITKSITVSALTAPDCDSGTTYLFGTVEIMADGVIFENFYVHPLTLFTADQAAITIYSSDVIVRHNTVEIQGDAPGGEIKGIWATAAPQYFQENVEISDNCVHDVINLAGSTPPTLVTKLDEGFNSGVPPSGWTTIVNNAFTWETGTYNPYEGSAYATCYYDQYYTGTQDEWLISPSFSLVDCTNTELSFAWQASYYWGYSPYNNYDLEVWVSVGGGSFSRIWLEDNEAPYTNWEWYPKTISLAAYEGNSDVRLGFVYYGYDGAQGSFDDVLVTCEEGGGPPVGESGAMGIKTQGSYWNVDVLRNEVYDVHSAFKSYGIEVQPYPSLPYTEHFQAELDFQEDFTGVSSGNIPSGWTRTQSTWGAYSSTYAGGSSPEMRLRYSSGVYDPTLLTPEIDTSDFTTLDFSYRQYINPYSTSDGPFEVFTVAGGTEYTIDTWNPSSNYGPALEVYTLTSAHGVGATDFQLGWRYNGNSWNMDYWYIDDIVLYGQYDYYQTINPWPEDVNIEENHIYRISLGEGYPSGVEPINPGVMLGLTEIEGPDRAIIVTDASHVVAFHNWFDMDCFVPALAIINYDLAHCLMATNNYYSSPKGPGSFGGDVFDCITGEIADGWGSQIVLLGDVAFDKWLGLKADAGFTDVIYATVGEPVLLDGSGSWAKDFTGVFEPVQFFWDKGDGYLSFEKTIAHIYTAPGTYEGFLRVHMLGIPEFGIPPMYDWDYFTVIVSSPDAPLTANGGGGSLGQYEAAIGEKITLFGTASGGTQPYTYQWDLGDGRIVYGQNPTVIYGEGDRNPETATYTVTLMVTDGNYDTATDTVTVIVLAPDVLNVKMDIPAHANAGMPLSFTSTVTGGAQPYEYRWNFGDGSDIVITPNPVHIFEHVGEYAITLTVIDDNDETVTLTETIVIESEEGTPAEIKQVNGGFRVSATIAAGNTDCEWSISVDGNFVLSGGYGSGIITANTEDTVKLPLTLAFGKVQITVTADSTQKQYTAFALGPLFLNMQEA